MAALTALPPPEADEDSLLELERSHEQSGMQRWALLRKVIAGIRTQMAEVFVGVHETRRQAASLDERLVHERADRESDVADLRAELRLAVEKLAADATRRREEERAVLDDAVSDLKWRYEALASELRADLAKQRGELQRGLDEEVASRHRHYDDDLKRFEEMRQTLKLSTASQQEALEKVAATAEALTSGLAAAKQERAASEAKAAEESRRLAQETLGRSGRVDAELSTLRASLEGVAKTVEAVERAQSGLGQLDGRLVEALGEVDAKLAAQRSSLEQELKAQVIGLNASLQERLSEEAREREAGDRQREQGLAALAASLERESSERKAGEERADLRLKEAREETAQRAERLALGAAKDATAELKQPLEDLKQRLAAEETGRVAAIDILRAESRTLGEALRAQLEEARAAQAAPAAASAQRLEAIEGEVRGCRAAAAEEAGARAALADRLGSELREGDRAALREAKELLTAEAARLRADLAAEADRQAKQTDAAAARTDQGVARALEDERARQEAQSRGAAREVKLVLEAQMSFAEDVAREQRQLSERIAALAADGPKSARRLEELEQDMGKVRDHLPILFVPANAFY